MTVDYSDDMHLDVTPLLRQQERPRRESWIFHHRPEAPSEPARRLIANPYGFAEWFKRITPPDHDFAEIYERRAREYEGTVSARAADSDPVPPQEPPFRKSKAVIVLQLLKRWRNVQYDARRGRRPPSIMISRLVADCANSTDSLSEELLHQSRSMLAEFKRWHSVGRCIHVANPVCVEDVLTDRWPRSLTDQGVFVEALSTLVANVERLVSGLALDEMQRIMIELFGEAPTADAFRDFNQRYGDEIRRGGGRYLSSTGGLVAPAVIVGESAAVPPEARSTPRHTFYGGDSIR